jgi:tetratricopeptide (TPR) repeat protein
MSVPNKHMAPSRHPWLTRFESVPEAAFGELLAGYADIRPYERADAPDAAHMLFGPLDPKDSARKALGLAIIAWLEKQRKQPLPAARPKLQRRVREICEAFEIVALLDVAGAAIDLRRRFLVWNDWIVRLVLSPARDALAEYLRTLALTQSLVAEAAPDIDANGLAPIWLRICREAGERLPRHYLSIGLLGLRRLPKVDQALQLPWVSGLAQWALARHPSDSEFKAEWLALKPLYPRAPQSWRRLVANLLSATTFKEEDIEAPAWWHVDRDFAPMVRGTFQSSDAPLRSPMPRDCERVIEKLNEPFDYVEPMIDDLFYGHRLYLHATGDAQYFVRAIHALGRELIDRGGDKPHARAKKAQSIAREGLKWQPYDRHLWALWRDSYVADNAAEAAELIGWEFIRRDPTDVNARTQLATILVNFLGKRDEAEILLKETIERFPDNAVARSELAELLIFEDRIAEAARVVNAAFSVGATDKATYALRARLYSNESRPDDARKAIKEGLELDPNERVLKEYDQRLSRGENLPLKSRAFSSADRSGQFGARPQLISDPALAEVIRFGTMRQLRFQLEFGSENDRESALQELRKALRDDPTFSYAELLAARHRIWEADVDVLPSFAAAFENALATEDREKLERLAIRQPRLEMLILMARAVLGDAEAARKIERWLREPEVTDGEQAIAGLHSALRPLLRVVEGGRSIKDALSEVRETVIGALHDANEAALGEALLAA